MVRIAVVGTGGMANGHVKAFQAIKGCRVVACCDIDETRAQAFAAKHGIPAVYTDLEQMLQLPGLDAVTNVTSDAAHYPTTMKALAAGKHVLCEKPLATGFGDARKMVEAARRAKLINMVNFSYRNSAAIWRAHELQPAGQ